MRIKRAIYWEMAIARESATVTYILAEIQKQAEEWESFIVEKRKSLNMLWLQAVGTGKL